MEDISNPLRLTKQWIFSAYQPKGFHRRAILPCWTCQTANQAAQAGCPQAHFRVINFLESWHCMEQYLLPGSAMQLQPSFAHFWGVVVVIARYLHTSTSDAGKLDGDVPLPAGRKQMFGMF